MLIKSFKALRNSYLLVLALILIVIPFVFSATLYVEIHEPVFDGTVASASTTIVNDPEANCPGTPGTTVSTSCTDFTYGSSCCATEGNYVAYAYSDEGESAGNSGIFVEYTVNWDNSETYCTCKVGSGHWNLGGEVAASSCCGDDSGEYVRNCVDSTDQGSCGADTTACCNSNTDCVDNYGLCESSGACYGTPIMGNSYCNSGTWENPDESSSYCVSSCDLTSGDQGIGWNLGGEIAATNCCGDDPSEYYRVCSDSSANGACGSDTTACCNSNTDCVYNNGCYTSGNCHGSGVMGNSYCSSGTWQDPDESSSYCVSSCDLTSGDQGIGWNLGGEIAATNCCGDDPSEYYRVCSDSSANGACGSDTTACCNSNTDCVYSNGCYATGSCYGSTVMGNSYCNSGTWEDPDESSSYCVSSCDLTSGDQGIGWNLGGEIAATNCCGDDPSEYYRVCSDSSANGACGSDTTACCNSNTDCVYNNGCYTSGNCHGSGVMGNSYCSSGTWQDPDESSSYCVSNCDQTSGDAGIGWNRGGEIAATTCCGDDPSEYLRDSAYDSSIDGSPPSSDACCNANNKCVYSNTCYSSGSSTVDVDSDGDQDYCSSGIWIDCNDNSQCDTSSGYHCVGNDCTNACNSNSECPSGFFCNSAGVCVAKLADGATCVGVTKEGTSSSEDEACQSGYCDNDGVGLADDNWCYTPNGNYDNRDNKCEKDANSGLNNYADERRNECAGTSGYVSDTCVYYSDGDANSNTCDCIAGSGHWITSASQCCGDDSGESFESPGSGNSCCINGEVVSSGSLDSTSQYLCIDGEIYGCNDNLGGIATQDSSCARRLSYYCDGAGTGANTWKPQIAHNGIPDDCDGVGTEYPYGTDEAGTTYDPETCVGNRLWNDYGNGISNQNQGYLCTGSTWYGPYIATCNLTQDTNNPLNTTLTIYWEVADEIPDTASNTGSNRWRIDDDGVGTGACSPAIGCYYDTGVRSSCVNVDSNEGTYGDYWSETLDWSSLSTPITVEGTYYLEVGEEECGSGQINDTEDPNSNEGSCTATATLCVPVGYTATSDSDCCPIGPTTSQYPGKDDDDGKCVECNPTTHVQTAGATGNNLCEVKCGADALADEKTPNACDGTSGWIDSSCRYYSDGDANSQTCSCVSDATSGDQGKEWNIGGEVSSTTCCGDDANEYDLICVGDTGACSGATDNKACCNANTDCVYNNACYANGATRGSYECDNGYWRLIGSYCGVLINGNVWNVTTQTGTKILSIDQDGDAVFFCNNMYQSTTPPGGLTNSLLIQVSGSLYYALNSNDCYVKGSILDKQSTVPAENGGDLVVKTSGTAVANFNSDSNIYLKGVAAYDGAQANCASGYTCDASTMKCT